jgi:hypothetical protein
MTLDELTQGLRALESAIATARQAVASGALVDLAGLDEEVARLCAAAPEAPSSARAELAARFTAIIAALDALAHDLVADEQESRKTAEDLARRRAAGAYARPQGG